MWLILLIAGLGWVAVISLVLALYAAAGRRDRAQGVRPRLRLVHSAPPDPHASEDPDDASAPRGVRTSASERSSAADSGSVRQAHT